jgi:hypothetical protein
MPPILPLHAKESLHELDRRARDGVDVALLGRKRDNGILVSVADAKTGGAFQLEVRDDEQPLDVFHHPYAYAALRGIDTTSQAADEDELPWAA